MYHLAKLTQPAICLEIGVEWGTSSAHLLTGGREYNSLVIGIDIINHAHLAKLKNDRHYIFLHGDSTADNTIEMVKHLAYNFGKIGIVYQDSSHHYLPSIREWELYSPFLADGAIWICDDITPAFYNTDVDPPGKGMIQYFEERPGQKKLYPDVLHRGNCQGVILL